MGNPLASQALLQKLRMLSGTMSEQGLAPTIPGAPVFGHFRQLRENPLDLFLQARQGAGDVARLQFGPVTAHLLSHPDHIRYVLQDNRRNFSKNTPGFRSMRLVVGDGLLTSEGDFWLRQRRIAQPAFHKQQLQSFSEDMRRATLEQAAGWQTGSLLDMNTEMIRLTLRIVGKTLFGSEVSGDFQAVSDAVEVLLRDIKRRSKQLLPIPLTVPTPDNRSFIQARETLDKIVFRMIRERRASSEESQDLLATLMNSVDDETGERMTDEQLRDEVMTLFLAGHETTANALTWTFYLLSKHPQEAELVYQEINAVLRDKAIEFSDMAKLPKLKAFFQETMRLYPPAWIMSRFVEEDDTIGGYPIPKHSLAVVSPYVTHRHPDWWPNPEGFDPRRFSPEQESKRPRFTYFPFGGGPRQCIGNGFAMMEAMIILATILQRYRLELVPGMEIKAKPLITLRPSGAVMMKLHERNA
jgi:cytochrome P450